MIFRQPLLNGVLLKRYKRFFAEIKHKETTILAHVPNSGSMRGCCDPGSLCRFSKNDDPMRKLKFTLEMVQANSTWVGVNTTIPNKIIHEAFINKTIDEWNKYNHIQKEVTINEKSRIDFALWSGTETKFEFKKLDLKKSKLKFHFIEVKNVSLAENNLALFPDAVTERGQKHLKDLMNLMDWGHTTEILFTIQRADATSFAPADHIDIEYGRLLRMAKKRGVLITPLLCSISENEISLTNKKLDLNF